MLSQYLGLTETNTANVGIGGVRYVFCRNSCSVALGPFNLSATLGREDFDLRLFPRDKTVGRLGGGSEYSVTKSAFYDFIKSA